MLGPLDKMQAKLEQTVQYRLPLGDQTVELNPLLGQPVRLRFTGNIFCVHCGKATKKCFNQGYCYPCFIKLAQCDMCIMKPETCHYAAGTCREPAWGEQFCMQPHIVYLANSSGIKVGITRQSQVPTRWIDQGAVQALPIFRVPSRHVSGLIEVIFGRHISDKTSWQQMLKNQVVPIDLPAERDKLLALCRTELDETVAHLGDKAVDFLQDGQTVTIRYPVDCYPVKVASFNLDKNPEVSGILHGIKGQYLMLDTGVINIRKFTGYEVVFSTA
jgi:hypothetical protein